MITATKKIICNKDFEYILNIGVLHKSPFIFKNLAAVLFRHGIDGSYKLSALLLSCNCTF